MSSTAISHEQVLAALRWPGAGLANVYLFGEGAEAGLAIALWHPEVGVRAFLIEDDELYGACRAYLRKVGARRFDSLDAIAEAARRERWPGWERWVV